jgi:hypothetical protein
VHSVFSVLEIIHRDLHMEGKHSLSLTYIPSLWYFETGSCIVQTGFELMILLLQPPKFQDYRCMLQHPASLHS